MRFGRKSAASCRLPLNRPAAEGGFSSGCIFGLAGLTAWAFSLPIALRFSNSVRKPGGESRSPLHRTPQEDQDVGAITPVLIHLRERYGLATRSEVCERNAPGDRKACIILYDFNAKSAPKCDDLTANDKLPVVDLHCLEVTLQAHQKLRTLLFSFPAFGRCARESSPSD
jgi:hypothetical protein